MKLLQTQLQKKLFKEKYRDNLILAEETMDRTNEFLHLRLELSDDEIIEISNYKVDHVSDSKEETEILDEKESHVQQ